MVDACVQHCQLINGSVNGVVDNRLCGSGPTEPLYQSELETPPDGTFYALIHPSSCTVTFTFYQSGDRTETRAFTPGFDDLAVTLTVPDVQRITADCSGGGPVNSTCNIDWFFLLHYCRCCRE